MDDRKIVSLHIAQAAQTWLPEIIALTNDGRVWQKRLDLHSAEWIDITTNLTPVVSLPGEAL